jgi:hypothetical protein
MSSKYTAVLRRFKNVLVRGNLDFRDLWNTVVHMKLEYDNTYKV